MPHRNHHHSRHYRREAPDTTRNAVAEPTGSAASERWPEDWEEEFEPTGDILDYTRIIAEYPVASLLVSFSIGFGLGILAARAFTYEDRRGWMERNRVRERLQGLASRAGERAHSIAEYVPEALAAAKEYVY